MIKIKYASPATPPQKYNIDINKVYDCEKCGEKYLIKATNYKQEFSEALVKTLFKPCEKYSWDMLDSDTQKETKTSVSKTKNNKQMKG